MRPVMDSYDAAHFAPTEFVCPRCAKTSSARFAGPCESCIDELRAAMRRDAVAIDAEYVPKVNVTANAVALKDD